MPTPSLEDQLQEAKLNISQYATLPPGEWPIGTIVPVYFPSKVEYPNGWTICAGQLISDKDSPFFGTNIPNLAEDKFIMGTILKGSYGQYGGTNQIPDSGDHTHPYTINKGGRAAQRSPDGFQAEGGDCKTAAHSTGGGGIHNHGGDNRPSWFGLIFIIKYK